MPALTRHFRLTAALALFAGVPLLLVASVGATSAAAGPDTGFSASAQAACRSAVAATVGYVVEGLSFDPDSQSTPAGNLLQLTETGTVTAMDSGQSGTFTCTMTRAAGGPADAWALDAPAIVN